jgi:glycosyltransferase involved in cell wall biosynthesis
MGRVDDVMNVAGHRLGTMEIESALVSHQTVAESAVVGRPDDLKGTAIVAFVTLEMGNTPSNELKEQLRSLIQDLHLTDCVRLTGFLPDEDVLKYYQSADFFVLPTVSLEGFGLVTIEAMACGTPALGTPIGGTKEILDRFDPSFLFKDTSPEAIAELIIEKYNYYQPRPDEYRPLREKCRRFVVDHFSWEINLEVIEREFRQCAASAEN